MATTPSLANIPAVYGATAMVSQLPTDGVGDFTVARVDIPDGCATRVNSAGLIESVASNVPRLDYSDGSCPVWLCEPTTTNLVTYSEDFSDASWVKSNASITSNDVISPDGTQNADFLFEDTANSTHSVIYGVGVLATDETFSVFAKSNGRQWFSIQCGSSFGYFDLNNGVVGTLSNTTGSSIDNYGNGWYRCSISFNRAVSTNNFIYLADSDNNATYLGDGTSGIYIWGAQLEQKSYPTSYVKTTGATATRGADAITGAGDVNTFNSQEGVLYAEMSALADDGTLRNITINDNTTNNSIRLYYSSTSNTLTYRVVVGGVPSVSLLNSTINQVDTIKVAVKWKANDFAVYVNGVKKAEQLSGVSFSANTLTTLDLKRPNNTEYFYGKVKQILTYDSAIAESEIEALTGFTSFSLMAQYLNYTIY